MNASSHRFLPARLFIMTMAAVGILFPLSSCATGNDAESPNGTAQVGDGSTTREEEPHEEDSDEEDHVLSQEQVETLETMVRTPDRALVIAGARPSYTTTSGRKQIMTIRDEDDLSYDSGHYVLTTYCMGENTLTIDFSIGEVMKTDTLSCSPESSVKQTELIFTGEQKAMAVQITPAADTPAEIAYRIDRLQ